MSLYLSLDRQALKLFNKKIVSFSVISKPKNNNNLDNYIRHFLPFFLINNNKTKWKINKK